VLRAHETELRAAGILRIAVFGSAARGDNSPNSDVDLLADFGKTKRYTLLTLGGLESRLAGLFGTKGTPMTAYRAKSEHYSTGFASPETSRRECSQEERRVEANVTRRTANEAGTSRQ
jgi:predicted nucleotidyltransferase